MKRVFKGIGKNLSLLNVAGFVLGAGLGLLFPRFFEKTAFIGTVYVNLLKLMVIPMLMLSVFNAIAGNRKGTGGLLLKALGLFALLFTLSFLLTSLPVSLFKPGVGANLAAEPWEGEAASPSLATFFTKLLPDNIFAAMGRGELMPCILFAAAAGVAAGQLDTKGVKTLAQEGEKLFSKLLGYVLYISPLGVFALMGAGVARFGGAVLGSSLKYVLWAWGACLLVLLAVMILPLWLFCRISPIEYFKAVGRVLLSALSTCSSAATLPETVRCCREEFQIPEHYIGLVTPLGCTVHMCGGAVSFALLGLFSLQMAGQSISLGLFLYMLLVALVMNMAAPGIPGGGILLGAGFLSIIGAPLSIMGVYAGIYRLLDMAYTGLNVAGDVTANLLLYRFTKDK